MTRFTEGDAVGVMLPAPFDGPLDYMVPEGMVLGPGDFVQVELGARVLTGIVWGAGAGKLDPSRLKMVAGRYDVPPMAEAMRRFLERAADYTLTPPGMMVRLGTRVPELGKPPPTRRVWYLTDTRPERSTDARARVIQVLEEHGGLGFGTAELAEMAGVSAAVVTGLAKAGVLTGKEVARDAPFPPLFGHGEGAHLSEGQAAAAEVLRGHVAKAKFKPVLLKGVTGSGKTEVYLEAVAECIAAGRQALVLVPEVALTSGFLARVEARFGARPGEWHHGIAPPERRRVWTAVAEGRVQLVVGARSALFLPFTDLGLIVVDEEHETSFKQEDNVLYNARDMAVLRAAEEEAVIVMASATPSLETWANAESGKYERLDLPERFGAAVMPEMRLVDLREHNPGRNRWISEPLVEATRARLGRGEQVLYFLNRRGYAPMTRCLACGHNFHCEHCDCLMVTHRFRNQLLCHQCGHVTPIPRACPACGRDDRLSVIGPGVERLADEAAELFPDARIEVLSSDLADGPDGLKQRLEAIASGEVDIIIGTQMVAKGHNFPLLTLVGVIDADMGLQGGDLRAAERTFQVIHQVAGRAGRADKAGVAMIQTASPDHDVMGAIMSGDPELFWRAEAAMRRDAGVPPYGRMAGVIVSGPDEAQVWEVANALARSSGVMAEAGAEVYGPAPAPFARLRGRHRVRLLVKAPKDRLLQPALKEWRAGVKTGAKTRVVIDIDPQSFV
ncbi:primosomal protein N' [Rhodobacteraceae bacterium NNCM2]|nr:primosomal protein N' [Coraliihabitans acroporae]